MWVNTTAHEVVHNACRTQFTLLACSASAHPYVLSSSAYHSCSPSVHTACSSDTAGSCVRQVQLEDWGDYTSNDQPFPRGEICVRGPSVFSGYFNRPDLTAKVLSGDGWLHTGDIGERLAEDQIRVVDRKHAMFKTAGGEWVSPDAVEVELLAFCV